MTRSELNALMTGGFATVTGGLLGAYAGMGIDIRHLLTASVISAPAALLIAKVLVPEAEPAKISTQLVVATEKESVNLIGAAVHGASDGLKLALNVGAMLIAFLALLAMVDWLLGSLGELFWLLFDARSETEVATAPVRQPLSLGLVLGYACAPLAWCMGVPWSEGLAAGELIGLKTVANEFIAYEKLGRLPVGADGEISQRTKVVLTYALAGFSNFGAVGIQVGGIGGLEPSRKQDLARLGLKAMFGGLLACCMTGSIAGLMLDSGDLSPASVVESAMNSPSAIKQPLETP
jgi:concentrative nucleoside transporter, CNT family